MKHVDGITDLTSTLCFNFMHWVQITAQSSVCIVDQSHSQCSTLSKWSAVSVTFALTLCTKLTQKYEGRLQGSWTHLITPRRNFVEVRWRSLFRSTSLGKGCTSYNSSPTSRKRAADRWSLGNFLPRSFPFMVRKAQKSHWIEFSGQIWKSVSVEPHCNIRHTVQISPHAISGRYDHEKGGPRQEISKWSTVCSTFSRSGWSVVRSASLVKGGTWKKRPSPHLHKVPIRSNKVSPRTFETVLVQSKLTLCVRTAP
jgi:hypothetical protein